MSDKVFYTRTMAQVYEKQGDLVSAARIYRYLLSKTPDHPDLVRALCEIDRRLGGGQARAERLKRLLERWIALVLCANDVRKLNSLVPIHESIFDTRGFPIQK